MDGLGISVALNWPNIAIQLNLWWLVIVFCALLVWHAFTRGRRGG